MSSAICLRLRSYAITERTVLLGVQRFLQRFDRLAVMTAVELRQIERE
ncbi:MAG: hypothetical protein ACLRSD_01545 [Oscillibacter sp.]